jgi:hypothetical protein
LALFVRDGVAMFGMRKGWSFWELFLLLLSSWLAAGVSLVELFDVIKQMIET